MIKATDKSEQDDIVAADTHNRLAKQIVAQIVNEPIAAGGTFSDFMVLCESMLVGVMIGCFQLGSDVKALDSIVVRAKERSPRFDWKTSKPRAVREMPSAPHRSRSEDHIVANRSFQSASEG
jgi:hypothetical protein